MVALLRYVGDVPNSYSCSAMSGESPHGILYLAMNDFEVNVISVHEVGEGMLGWRGFLGLARLGVGA